jgi:uncharacterized iron-regulated membrane protein
MPNLDSSDLRDPQPPIPGERERALVARRAGQLGRRRRLLQGGGALALVAVAVVSVAALTGGGASGPAGTNRVEAANSGADTTLGEPTTPATTPATEATVPAPAPTSDTAATDDAAPAVVPDGTSGPVQPAEVPSTYSLSGMVSGFPAGDTVSVTLNGDAGPFTAPADASGNFSLSGLAAGTYRVVGQRVDPSGTATYSEAFGSVTIDRDSTANFAFQH